jgi:type I restriction enzyme, S subunit
MTQTAYKYLKFVQFSELECWSVKVLTQKKQSQSHLEYISLDRILTKNRITTQIQDDTTYNRVTIKLYNKGLKIRDTVKGSTIGVKRQTIVKEGQFILSKIDARSGAFGIVTNELEGAITTADFLSYNVNNDIIESQYLRLFTTLKRFTDLCENASTGTTGRKRISEGLFLKMQIPLPPKTLQQELVREHKAKIDQANENRENADMLESKIESYLMDELGITITEKVKQDNGYKFLQFVNFKDIQEWGISNKNSVKFSNKFPVIRVEDKVDFQSGVTYSKANESNKITKYPILRSNNIDQKSNSLFLHDIKYIDNIEINKSKMLYKNDIFICTANGSKDHLGKFAFIEQDSHYYFGGFMGVLRSKELPNLNPKFTYCLMLSKIYKNFINDNTAGTNINNLKVKKLLSLQIPLPPMETQNQIVQQIDIWKAQIKKLTEQALKLEQSAKVDFEQAIFDPQN